MGPAADSLMISISKRDKMIRDAGPQDIDRLVEMLVNFANAAPITLFKDPKYNMNHVVKLFHEIQQNGVLLVGEIDGRVEGMLIAKVVGDPWMPQLKVMREMAWWVEPQHRNSTLGYKLLAEYKKLGVKAIKAKLIDTFTITTLVDSPIRNIERHGWRPVEQNYVYGDV